MTTTAVPPLPESARYSFGGDEFLLVEVAEAMSLAANVRVMSMARALQADRPDGITDICPANASLLLRFDPDVIAPQALTDRVQQVEESVKGAGDEPLQTRIIEVPVAYDDPITAEVAGRFRANHQAPEGTDLDYAAAVNNLPDKAAFIERHHGSAWLVSMVGFVAGLPFMFQLTDQQHQLEVPKYLSPRTDTPALTVGHGGCFACIYSVRGAGGYQMFGIAAAPIYDPEQRLADFADGMVLFRPGDLVRFRPVDTDEYQRIQAEVADGSYRYRQRAVSLDLSRALADPVGYNAELRELLDGA
ncbi:5-oxoprolinase subunit B family protein [Nakamurella aerolata]|uniref:Carboxyltransferase domain-containing protein n=1 Tax=Nakamurella aerolata TaxID=1656892 RepID=A0A849A4E2_9ACTN|nr:carboxyltransferase domain-containing protein [Nakamurella aerolata]NNG35864.1 carboxyltransferase domain-containing protein [Nakamurella aerolata]